MSDIGGVRMYFGTASGSARKALRQIEEPHIMLSAQSTAAIPWENIGHLFLDSGGYSLMIHEGEHPPVDDYLDTVNEYDADMWAIQDYPCEPDILDKYGRSVLDHQAMTTETAAHCLMRAEERGIESTPVSVIQGWELEDYIRHIDMMRDAGCLTEYIGIGSVCRRNQTSDIREIIKTVRSELPSKHKLHAFGVKNEILSDKQTREALWSADTTAWYYQSYKDRNEIDDAWQMMVGQYLDYRKQLGKISGCLHASKEESQTTLV